VKRNGSKEHRRPGTGTHAVPAFRLQGSSLRHLFLPVVTAVCLVSACGGGDAPPAAIDGTWNATAQSAGSSLAVTLRTQDSVVSGAGVYVVAGGRPGVLAVAGTYQPPAALLTFKYDSGATALFAATAADGSHLNGTLTHDDGTSVDLRLVRQ